MFKNIGLVQMIASALLHSEPNHRLLATPVTRFACGQEEEEEEERRGWYSMDFQL